MSPGGKGRHFPIFKMLISLCSAHWWDVLAQGCASTIVKKGAPYDTFVNWGCLEKVGYMIKINLFETLLHKCTKSVL